LDVFRVYREIKCKNCGGKAKWKSSYHNLPTISRKLDPGKEYFVEERFICTECGKITARRWRLTEKRKG